MRSNGPLHQVSLLPAPIYPPIPSLLPPGEMGTVCVCLCCVVVEAGEQKCMMHDHICRSWKLCPIWIAILNLFLCLPQIV